MKHRPRNRAILANESGPVTPPNAEVPVVIGKSEPSYSPAVAAEESPATVTTEERPTEERPTEERPTEEQPTEERPTEEQLTEEPPVAGFVRVRVVGQAVGHENVCYEKGQSFQCSSERARALGPFVEVLP